MVVRLTLGDGDVVDWHAVVKAVVASSARMSKVRMANSVPNTAFAVLDGESREELVAQPSCQKSSLFRDARCEQSGATQLP